MSVQSPTWGSISRLWDCGELKSGVRCSTNWATRCLGISLFNGIILKKWQRFRARNNRGKKECFTWRKQHVRKFPSSEHRIKPFNKHLGLDSVTEKRQLSNMGILSSRKFVGTVTVCLRHYLKMSGKTGWRCLRNVTLPVLPASRVPFPALAMSLRWHWVCCLTTFVSFPEWVQWQE